MATSWPRLRLTPSSALAGFTPLYEMAELFRKLAEDCQPLPPISRKQEAERI